LADVAEKNRLELRVVAPGAATDKKPYKVQRKADMVIMRCVTGDMGILPGRVPVSAVLEDGIMRIYDNDTEHRMVVLGGVMHTSDNIVTILSDTVLKPEEINSAELATKIKEFQHLYNETNDLNKKAIYKKDIQRCQVQIDAAVK